MALENPFLLPRKLDGSLPDPTHRRGWADDGDPTRLTRMAQRGERMITQMISGLSVHADGQYGTDQIPITEAEQLLMEASKGSSDLEAEAGIFGPESVQSERVDSIKQAFAGPRQEPMLAPLEEELPSGP